MKTFLCVAILLLSLFLAGCPPKTASILNKNDSNKSEEEWYSFTTKNGDLFRTGEVFIIDSLNQRLTDPKIDQINIELLNGSEIRSQQVQFSRDTLYYFEKTTKRSIDLLDVYNISIVDKFTGKDVLFYSGMGVIFGAGFMVLPASNRVDINKAGSNMFIGAGVGMFVSNVIGYRKKK